MTASRYASFLFALVASLSLCLRATAQDAAPHNRLSPEEIAAGWIRLFDGDTLFGWNASNDVNWKVSNGVISADSGDPGLLLTTTEFSDFELRCDFRLAEGGNSGIFLRTPFSPKDPSRDCYELNMCDSHPAFPTGSLVGVVKPTRTIKGEGAWHSYHITCLGHKIVVTMDGQPVLDFMDSRDGAVTRGFIGLQKNAGLAEYRNISLRPLSTTDLFNGKDLSGWRTVPGGKSTFEVKDGAIEVKNGPGFLETEATAGDFILQADVRTNGTGLNSGIFFRAQPGTQAAPSNGYEAQIHNVFKENDRAQPVDFGTGAIYRRVAARRVVSNDLEWLTMTLAAQGPHISVWVNGEQVTDWTDTRKPDANPRKGLRLAPGHISLQGHDPTTHILFKNFKLLEFPATAKPKN